MGAFRDALFGAKNGDSKAVELLYEQFSPLLLKCSIVNGHRDEDLPANFKNILAVCRSRNISCDIILQSKSQIQSLYKDDWEGMIGNCDSLIYLGGNEYATFEWLSKYIGKMTERTTSQSIGRGSRGSSSDSYQLTARDLCSSDEIRRMDDGDCLVLLRSEPPVIDHKFDLMRHPNVKLTPDGGAAPYRMPDDYAQTAQTLSML